MPTFSTEKILPYTPDELYAVVADIEHYPTFIPYIEGARIIDTTPDATIAELRVAYKGISGRYTSRVLLDSDLKEISVELAQGPFKHLYQGWKFTAAPGGARVEFDIDFQMRSRLIEMLVSGMFESAIAKIMTAFENRAKMLYRGNV
jgi:coenzyme Q-binding protein COQ10